MTSVPTVLVLPLPSRKEVKVVANVADDGLLVVRLGHGTKVEIRYRTIRVFKELE